MRDPDSAPLEAAQRRLERALVMLEGAAEARRSQGSASLFDAGAERERQKLEVELGAARSRERALEQVAAEASAALGRAAAEVRAALAAGA